MNYELLKNCKLCPRECGANRLGGKRGYCLADDKIYIARAALHFWEEPCISGESGSGTVFFSGCSMKCVFCQNYDISTEGFGKEVSVERLAEIFSELQNQGANNINLVTPTHYTLQIKDALKIAKNNGLKIPIVYNCSGYEKVETLKLLEGLVDIYLPDFKYFDNSLAIKYSNADNYFKTASLAVSEMLRQTGGENIFDENGIMKKGVIVRHLLLPENIENSKKVISYLYTMFGDKIYISIMNQYTPIKKHNKFPELNKTISKAEYDEAVEFAVSLGVENGFIQDGETAKESFIPKFNLEGI